MSPYQMEEVLSNSFDGAKTILTRHYENLWYLIWTAISNVTLDSLLRQCIPKTYG